ncbi:thioredoxin-dependent thiol peroxidase [Virgibacillus soli]|uniref:thioredoxin-dependent peroxiredoxin n=1 Tax=Paracerasibacillus soli TaxID=480284 RepID=A0ABU5CMK0_9BACI|nr:thioredoxin-dependent thiol peroxidase [Virgibacillus soli]MDY0407566.1 thioredoxin-dependent thiol peroxidase [Virgibacillus soli]
MSIEIGKQAPNFTLESQTGERVSLSDFKGKNVVLYFYPKDMTPGCTTQACDFRDSHESFHDVNAVIIGISPDPIARHQKFIDKYDLPFSLLADENHEVAEAYGVWKLKKMFGKEYYGIERSTFIIDKESKVQKEYRKVRVKGHVEEALTYIKENNQVFA